MLLVRTSMVSIVRDVRSRPNSARGSGMAKICVALLALTLAACGTAAQKTEFNNSAVVNHKKDAVWERLLEYFTRNNIQIKTIEKASGVLCGARELRGEHG